jgi:hypothetical protein
MLVFSDIRQQIPPVIAMIDTALKCTGGPLTGVYEFLF